MIISAALYMQSNEQRTKTKVTHLCMTMRLKDGRKESKAQPAGAAV